MKKQLKKKPLTKATAKPLTKKPLTKPQPKGKSLTKKPATSDPVIIKRAATAAQDPTPKVTAPMTKPQPPKPKSGPMPVVPKGHTWKGTKEKYNGVPHLLVKPDDMPKGFPRPAKHCPPNSYFRVNPKTNAVTSMVTLMPHTKQQTQVKAAWATCPACNNHFLRCICAGGFTHCRGIEWIYIRSLMRVDGEPVASDPMIDSTGHAVQSRALYWYRGKETGRVPAPRAYPDRAAQGTTGTGGQSGATKPSKPLRKAGSKPLRKAATPPPAWEDPTPPIKSPAKPMRKAAAKKSGKDDFTFDLSQTNKDAAKSADALADSLVKSLSKPGTKSGKSLKKRGK